MSTPEWEGGLVGISVTVDDDSLPDDVKRACLLRTNVYLDVARFVHEHFFEVFNALHDAHPDLAIELVDTFGFRDEIEQVASEHEAAPVTKRAHLKLVD